MPLDNLLILIRFFKSKVITLFGSLCNQKRKKKIQKTFYLTQTFGFYLLFKLPLQGKPLNVIKVLIQLIWSIFQRSPKPI